MTDKKFFKIFFLTLFSLVTIHLLIISYVNPQLTAPIKLSKTYQDFHENILYRKVELMKNFDFETLVLGSSTSEAISIQDTNQIFSTKTFHGSIGGGNTPARYTLFKKALAHSKNLKRVIYVADLYEFNQPEATSMLAFNRELRNELEDYPYLPGLGGYGKHLFSNQLIESVFNVIKRKSKGYVSPVLVDGSTSVSMVLSDVETDNYFTAKIHPAMKQKLHDEIEENYQTYSKQVLSQFLILNPEVKKLFTIMVEEALKRNIEVIFIMAPYHVNFRTMLFQDREVVTRYQEWIEFFNLLSLKSGVKVLNPLETIIATDPESGVWRDGIHFNSAAATVFLKQVKEMND